MHSNGGVDDQRLSERSFEFSKFAVIKYLRRDRSVVLKIRKQYNMSPVGDYLD